MYYRLVVVLILHILAVLQQIGDRSHYIIKHFLIFVISIKLEVISLPYYCLG